MKCAALDGCLAMTFRMNDGLCNFLNRTYEGKFEESDDRLVANKIDSCDPSQEVPVVEMPQGSKKAQKCFSKVIFGRSPGSNFGNSTEASVEDCMTHCASRKGCQAMTYRLSDGLCNFLDRSYDGKFEESNERLLANRLDSCEGSHKKQMLHKDGLSIKVSEKAQKCFTKVIHGRSPGSNIGSSTEANVDDCMSSCVALEGCLAMTFRMSDGLCNLLNRTYDEKYEKTDDRVVANKLDSCVASQKTQVMHKAKVEMPKISEKAQECFTKVTFGKSPGSNLGNSTETSVDDCMSKCASLDGCLAMTFRLDDGLCNFLDRTYEGKYEQSDERLVADKIEGCQAE